MSIFLAYVVDSSKKEEVKLEIIPIVRKFPNVFLSVLPGLFLKREIDFEINLASSVEPISKAPYQMAPTELKEHKVQFQ